MSIPCLRLDTLDRQMQRMFSLTPDIVPVQCLKLCSKQNTSSGPGSQKRGLGATSENVQAHGGASRKAAGAAHLAMASTWTGRTRIGRAVFWYSSCDATNQLATGAGVYDACFKPNMDCALPF